MILEKDGETIDLDSVTEEYLERAVKEKNVTLLHTLSRPRQNKLIELAIWRDKKWANGKTIKVKFLGGTQFLRAMVRKGLGGDFAKVV